MKRKHKVIKILISVIGAILICAVSFRLGVYSAYRNDNSNTNTTTNDNNISGDNTETTAGTTTENTTTTEESEGSTDGTKEDNDVTDIAEDSKVTYSNTQFGFDFNLPASWEGYSIQTEVWQGRAVEGEQQGQVVETGIKLFIRHPEWTLDNPRQDIPIMVFTLDQWEMIEKEALAVGAAPIAPSKLGSNSKYVFALPARYNYAFLTGFEEIEDIIAGNALVPTENIE